MSLIDRRVAGLVLVPLLPRVIRKHRAELAKVGGDLVAPGDRALVGRLSDRVLSVKRFEGLQIAPQDRVSDSIHDLTRLPHVRLLSSDRDEFCDRTTGLAMGPGATTRFDRSGYSERSDPRVRLRRRDGQDVVSLRLNPW